MLRDCTSASANGKSSLPRARAAVNVANLGRKPYGSLSGDVAPDSLQDVLRLVATRGSHMEKGCWCRRVLRLGVFS